MDALEQVKKLREEYERALDAAGSRRAAYHEAVLDLYRSGTPLREIAKELGLSHQRVHQIVSGEPPRCKKKLPRAAGGIGAALVLVAATFGALRIAHASPFSMPVSAAQDAAACLSGQGWSVARHSSGVIVASDGLYTLVYQPSERKRLRHYVGGAGEVVHPGWSGFGPHGSLITVADETKIAISVGAPSCFLQYRQYARAIHAFASSSH